MLRTIAAVLVLLPAIALGADDSGDASAAIAQTLSGLAGDWNISAAQPSATRSVATNRPADVWDLSALDSIAVTAACEDRGIALLYLRWRITSKSGGLYELEEP